VQRSQTSKQLPTPGALQTLIAPHAGGRSRRTGWQPVHAPDVDDALPGRAEPGQQRGRSFRPAELKCHPLSAPRIYLSRVTRDYEIRAVGMKEFREFRQPPFNLVLNLARLGVDQTRRDARDHMLICGAALQR